MSRGRARKEGATGGVQSLGGTRGSGKKEERRGVARDNGEVADDLGVTEGGEEKRREKG